MSNCPYCNSPKASGDTGAYQCGTLIGAPFPSAHCSVVASRPKPVVTDGNPIHNRAALRELHAKVNRAHGDLLVGLLDGASQEDLRRLADTARERLEGARKIIEAFLTADERSRDTARAAAFGSAYGAKPVFNPQQAVIDQALERAARALAEREQTALYAALVAGVQVGQPTRPRPDYDTDPMFYDPPHRTP